MLKHIKWILTGLFLLFCLALFIWGEAIPVGAILAGLAVIIAAIKSKLFGSNKLLEKMKNIQNIHEAKRQQREEERKIHHQHYDSLKNRIEELSIRIEILDERLKNAKRLVYRDEMRSEGEILGGLGRN